MEHSVLYMMLVNVYFGTEHEISEHEWLQNDKMSTQMNQGRTEGDQY